MHLVELQNSLHESRRISSLWRNTDDTVRARIYDRRDIGAEGKGTFGIDIFLKTENGFETENPIKEIGDVFYSKESALDYLLERWSDLKPFRLPQGADTYTYGW